MRNDHSVRHWTIRASGVLVLLACAMNNSSAQQNVILVVLDACRADAVDASRSGIPLMPNLSAFPAVRFQRAYATSGWTSPSMMSIFTSTHVDTHQVHVGPGFFPGTMESMGEYFREAGYTTLGVQTNGNLTAELGYARGFDQYIYQPYQPAGRADWVTATALSLIEGISEPYFLYVHYMEPHVPYAPPPAYRALMGYPPPALSPEEQAIAENILPYQLDYLGYHLGLQPELTYPQLSSLGEDAVRALYDGEVRYNDEQLAILLAHMADEHPDSIIIITADHGEHFWEHNSLGHTTTVYEPLTHVPLFIRAPGLAPAASDTLVSTVDILPTLAALLNLPVRNHWEGRDLLGERAPDGPLYACGKARVPWHRNLQMIRHGDMKLIRNYTTGETELYDIASDPGELHNLSASRPETLQAMTTLLHVHLLENARANGPDDVVTAVPDQPLNEGRTVRLTAPAGTGHVWFRNGVPVENAPPRITGADTGTLVISGVTLADMGSYECIATDDLLLLSVTTPYMLTVQPGEPMPAGNALRLMVLVLLVLLTAAHRLCGRSAAR